jgi:hypothetical protein
MRAKFARRSSAIHAKSSLPAKKEQLEFVWGLSPESQGQNLAVTVLCVPNSPYLRNHIWENSLYSKLSGDKVYFTSPFLSVMVKHSCSKLHCRELSIETLFLSIVAACPGFNKGTVTG